MPTEEAKIPREEIRARVDAVAAQMERAGLDAILCFGPENIYYLTGYACVAYFGPQVLLLTADGEATLLVRLLEIPSAHASSQVQTIIPIGEQAGLIASLSDAIESAGLSRARIGFEKPSRWISQSQAEELQTRNGAVAFADSFGVVEQPRLCKSDFERDAIRKAASVAAAAMRQCAASLEVGRTEREIAAEVTKAQIAAGSDWTGTPFFISSGLRSGWAHVTWTDRKLAAGDPLFLETNATHRRYHAAYMRSAHCGRPGARYQAMLDASRAGLEAALGKIRAGVAACDVDDACRTAIARSGCGTSFRINTGYSIGIGFENFSEASLLRLKPGNTTALQAGMVLHLVPYLSEDDLGGAAISETVAVTETGFECMAALDRDLIVI
jgi:Xaa-Pro dipeptidase